MTVPTCRRCGSSLLTGDRDGDGDPEIGRCTCEDKTCDLCGRAFLRINGRLTRCFTCGKLVGLCCWDDHEAECEKW